MSLLHVPSKHMMLMIGGTISHKPLGIWKFCLIAQEWTKLPNLDFNHKYVDSVLSSNEDYILITRGAVSDKISVLDIRDENEYKLRECKIKLPKVGKCLIVRMGGIKDEILTIGWIKELFKTKQFKKLALPPPYLMKMISLYYNQEMLHWFYDENSYYDDAIHRHQAIKLKHILSS